MRLVGFFILLFVTVIFSVLAWLLVRFRTWVDVRDNIRNSIEKYAKILSDVPTEKSTMEWGAKLSGSWRGMPITLESVVDGSLTSPHPEGTLSKVLVGLDGAYVELYIRPNYQEQHHVTFPQVLLETDFDSRWSLNGELDLITMVLQSDVQSLLDKLLASQCRVYVANGELVVECRGVLNPNKLAMMRRMALLMRERVLAYLGMKEAQAQSKGGVFRSPMWRVETTSEQSDTDQSEEEQEEHVPTTNKEK